MLEGNDKADEAGHVGDEASEPRTQIQRAVPRIVTR